MNFINLIGILFIFYLTKESCGNLLQCTDNANCTTIDATASCTLQGGFCQCPAGYVFSSDFTQCIPEVLYGDQCTDGVQCSHMLTGAYCDETRVCSCKSDYTYIRGRCRKLANLDEGCNEDIDCQFNFDRESVTCRNNVCSCADGFYFRTENVCRRISMNNDDPCIVNTDCQGPNLFCKQNATGNTCLSNTIGVQTELFSLPQTRSVSTQADEIVPLIAAEEEPEGEEEEKEEIEPANFGDLCTNEGAECVGLTQSVCRNNFCHCRPGYYKSQDRKKCSPEIGEPAPSAADCVGAAVSYRNGKCVCDINRFSNNNLRTCVKASIGYGEGCTQHSQCTPYGLAYCTSIAPKECICHPYAAYNETTELCVHKVGYEEYCTNSNTCTLPNTVCSNENTCICATNYLEVDGSCRPGDGAPCTTSNDCGFNESECVENVAVETPEKYCKCKKGLTHYNTVCLPEVQHEKDCLVDEQCKPLLGEFSECKDSKCTCKDGAHFKDEQCHPKKKLNEACSKPGECYLEENSSRAICRNSACKCNFDYSADVEKQQCIVIKANPNKNSSGRPSPLKVITIILMTSAALITSAAIREAYFVR